MNIFTRIKNAVVSVFKPKKQASTNNSKSNINKLIKQLNQTINSSDNITYSTYDYANKISPSISDKPASEIIVENFFNELDYVEGLTNSQAVKNNVQYARNKIQQYYSAVDIEDLAYALEKAVGANPKLHASDFYRRQRTEELLISIIVNIPASQGFKDELIDDINFGGE